MYLCTYLCIDLYTSKDIFICTSAIIIIFKSVTFSGTCPGLSESPFSGFPQTHHFRQLQCTESSRYRSYQCLSFGSAY